MIVKSLTDRFRRRIVLTDERWEHIIERHPEFKNNQDKVLKTVEDPEIIVENPFNESVNLYHRLDKRLKAYVIVIVEIKEGFIVTSYLSSRVKKGEVIWQKT